MNPILETDRLILREFTSADAEVSFELNSDPEVMKYTGDVPFKSIEAARIFLSNYDHYKKYGFGRWAVILKPHNEFIGWCGLKFHPDKNEYDIGYRFFQKHWGKGYATEASQACIKLGFEKFKMPSIVGNAMRANKASIRVFEKLEMKFLRDDTCGDNDGVVYVIEKI